MSLYKLGTRIIVNPSPKYKAQFVDIVISKKEYCSKLGIQQAYDDKPSYVYTKNIGSYRDNQFKRASNFTYWCVDTETAIGIELYAKVAYKNRLDKELKGLLE